MAVSVLGDRGQQVNLLIKQGATFGPFSVTINGPDGTTPVDLTGSTIRAQMRKTALNAAVVESFNVVISAPTDGVFEFGLTDEETAALTAGETLAHADSKYVWDMEWEDATGRVLPLFFGDVQVFREVTRVP